MRFTASKETRNPNTDFICWLFQRAFIVIQKSVKVTTQFFCNHIFRQFLNDGMFIILCDFNDPVDVTVNI